MTFSRSRGSSGNPLGLEKLEPRNLLATLSPWDLGEPAESIPADCHIAATPNDGSTSQAEDFSARLLSQATGQATGQLGILDDRIVVNESQSLFDQVDQYQFQVDASGEVAVALEFDRETRSALLIFDQGRNFVAGSHTAGGHDTQVSADLPAGTYSVFVLRGYGRYRLTLQSLAPPAPGNTAEPGSGPTVPPTQPGPVDSGRPESLADSPYYGGSLDWNLNELQAPEAWQAGYTGRGVVVAVIDTGVDIHHQDLNHNIWRNLDEIMGDGIDNDRNGFIDDRYGWNFVSESANVGDDNGHGTHVAGIIAAEKNGAGSTGVAPDSQVMAIKALDADGSGSYSGIARGIRYAVDNGAQIINLSLGGAFSNLLDSALRYAAAHDVLIIAAAGNESSSTPGHPAALSGVYSNLLSVGAMDQSGQPASFSNRVGGSKAVQVDAPGVTIYSTRPGAGYGFMSGTSMAAPHVSGLAALTLSAKPNLDSNAVRQVIVAGSDRHAVGSDSEGIVNAAISLPLALHHMNALQSSIPASSTIPISDQTPRARSLSESPRELRVTLGSELEMRGTAQQTGDIAARTSLNLDSGDQPALSLFAWTALPPSGQPEWERPAVAGGIHEVSLPSPVLLDHLFADLATTPDTGERWQQESIQPGGLGAW